MMNIIAKFEHLSGKEKLAVVAAAGLLGYVTYDFFAGKKAMAQTAPALAPSSGISATPAAVPIAASSTMVNYRVVTEVTPLLVRNGPGRQYKEVGSNPKDTIVKGTGQIVHGTVDGAPGDWAAILTPDGKAWGWSAMKYLASA